MVSEKIIRAAERTIKRAEKVMPVEAKLYANIRGFFKKKSHRLIVSGITALVFLWLIFILSCEYWEESFLSNFLIIVAGYIEITAFGAFVANIRKFSLVKFGISAGIWSVFMYTYFSIIVLFLCGYDPQQIEALYVAIRRFCVQGIFVCPILTAAAVFTAYLMVRKKPNIDHI